jgi:phage terminase small subunit
MLQENNTMARHPQPDELARLKGADKKNPQRYSATVPKSDLPLGNAPDHMSEAASACWFELSSMAIPGTMTGADRVMLEVLSNLLAEYRTSPVDFAVGKYTHLISSLARFGMSPSDRNKLGVDKPGEQDNPFANLDD